MTAQATQVLEGALHLSPLERAELIEQILRVSAFRPVRQMMLNGQERRRTGLMPLMPDVLRPLLHGKYLHALKACRSRTVPNYGCARLT